MVKKRHNVGYLIDGYNRELKISINKYFWNKKKAIKYWKKLLLQVKLIISPVQRLDADGRIVELELDVLKKSMFITFYKIVTKKGIPLGSAIYIVLEEI